MKVKLVFERGGDPEVVIGMSTIPRVGDKIMLEESEPAEVIDVLHTPMDADYEAVLFLRKGKM